MLTPDDRGALIELAPLLRRAVQLDPHALARFRLSSGASTVLARLPFGVLVSRTVRVSAPAAPRRQPIDITVSAADMLAWLDETSIDTPVARDLEWRADRPPERGWRRVESVPGDVVRALVRQGAVAVQDVAGNALNNTGLRGSAHRSSAADAVLDSTVLTAVAEDGTRVAVTLRVLSALVRMGFLPRGGQVFVDVAGRWARIVAAYGTVYLQHVGRQLTIR